MNKNYPPKIRIAVPPGVGDVYWCLAKLRSFREKHHLEHVTFCVQKTHLTRAVDWPLLTNLVDASEEFNFKRNPEMDLVGFSRNLPGVHCAMWPNTVLDRGLHLRDWMPEYDLDLEFEIKTADTPKVHQSKGRVIVFPSSLGTNKAWFPNGGPTFWNAVLQRVYVITGRPALVIGCDWDKDLARMLSAPYEPLIGQTSLAEIAGILKHAGVVIGIISGMTILANHFQTPCVAIYPDKFQPGFLKAWIRAFTPYIPIKASIIHVPIPGANMVVGDALELMRTR